MFSNPTPQDLSNIFGMWIAQQKDGIWILFYSEPRIITNLDDNKDYWTGIFSNTIPSNGVNYKGSWRESLHGPKQKGIKHHE